MDMNALNAAIRMSRAQSSQLPQAPVPFAAAVAAAPGLPGYFPSQSYFKPGVAAPPPAAPLDWSLYGGMVRGGGSATAATASTSSHRPAMERRDPPPAPSTSTADQPLDLSVGSDRLNRPSSGSSGAPVAGPSSTPRVYAINSPGDMAATASSAPLDLTKSTRVGKHAATVSPRSPISSSKGPAAFQSVYEGALDRRVPESYAGGSNSEQPCLAAPKISLNCRRCSFACNDTIDFQKHFTLAHNSIPSMDDIIVTSGTTRPSHTVTHYATAATPVWPQKMPAPKESVRFHCSHCGWQCDIGNAEMFTKHVTEHVSDSGSSYKCYYCKTDYHDPNLLREHIAAHAGINHYICSFCCIAFSNETMATAHMEQKHGLSLSHTDVTKWPVSNSKMSSHSPLSVGGHHTSGLLNIKKEAPEVATARVPPSYRSDVPAPTKMAAVSPISRPISNSSPESSKSNDSNCAGAGSAGCSSRPRAMKRTGFGQSLAKHIEAAISRELMGNKSPTVSDLMFMKSTGGDDPENPGQRSSSSDNNNPLNLMSLLDKVVEESLRNVPIGTKPEKPDLKFMVTFSDDEDDAVASKETGSSSGTEKKIPVKGKLSPNSAAVAAAKDEAVVSSSETALISRRSSKGEHANTDADKLSMNVPSPQPSHVSHSAQTSSSAYAEGESEGGNKIKDLRHDSSVSKRALQDNQQETSSHHQQQQPECKRERRDSSS